MQDLITYFSFGICIMVMTLSIITDSLGKVKKILLFFLAFSALLLLICNKLTRLYDGSQETIGRILAQPCKFMAYFCFLAVIAIFNRYVTELLKDSGISEMPKVFVGVEIETILGTVILLMNLVGKFYYFYEGNTYARAEFYFVAYMFPLIALLVELFGLLKFRENMSKRMLFPLLVFIILPFCAGVAQFFIHGVSLTGMSIVLMTAILYCFSVFDTNEKLEKARKRDLEILQEKQEMSEQMIHQTTSALAEAIDAKDKYTQGHSRRVAEYSVMIAQMAGKSKEECDELYLIALLHDVGKIGIPDAIINKEGKLTDEEFAIIKTHPSIGRDILSKIDISPHLSVGASFHHERYDGNGYPFKLKGKEIPELARIIACADAYDAMASKRSYRDVLPKEVIRAEFEKNLGKQFDPEFGRIMIGIIDADIYYELREK